MAALINEANNTLILNDLSPSKNGFIACKLD
jgi:hypothetical protein